MLRKELVRLVVVSAACVLPAACATTHYSRSGIETLPAGLKGKAGANASIEIEGLKLRVETLDQAPKQTAVPPLALRLVFDPRELGYSFDPAQVVLRGADGATSRPRVYGPGQFVTASWACAGGSSAGSEPRYHSLAPGSCFELTFDVAVLADSQLELALGGLARGSRRIDAVALKLARRTGTSIDRVYWLEALLAPLAYAPYAR